MQTIILENFIKFEILTNVKKNLNQRVMKNSFKKALKIFKYLTILFSVIFWICLIIDDYVFIKKYGMNIEGIEIWVTYFFIYLLGFTFGLLVQQ